MATQGSLQPSPNFHRLLPIQAPRGLLGVLLLVLLLPLPSALVLQVGCPCPVPWLCLPQACGHLAPSSLGRSTWGDETGVRQG